MLCNFRELLRSVCSIQLQALTSGYEEFSCPNAALADTNFTNSPGVNLLAATEKPLVRCETLQGSAVGSVTRDGPE